MNIKTKKLSKKIFILIIFTALFISMLGFKGVFADSTQKVKVPFFTDRPYFMTESESGKKTGYAYDYYQTLSNYTGWEYEYVYGSFDELYNEFINGNIDVFPAVSKTEEAKKYMMFPEHAMGSMICRLYTLDSNTEISCDSLETLNDITVGVTKGNTLISLFADVLEEEKINCSIIEFDTYDEKISEFENGNIDAIIDFEALAQSRWNSIMSVGSYDYYIAVSDERQDLYEQLHDVLDTIYDRSPYYNNIMYYEYYLADAISKTESDMEKEWIENNGEFTVGLINQELVTDDYGDQNKFIRTVIARMLYELNLHTINPVYVEYSDYDELLEAIKNGEVDAAYPICNDVNLAENFGYSIVDTLEETPMDIVTARDIKEEEIKKIVVSDMKQYYYCLSNYPSAEIECLGSKEKCLDAVSEKKADATIIKCHLTDGAVEITSKYSQLIYKDNNSMGCALAVDKDSTALYSLFKRGISAIDFDYINHMSKGTSFAVENYGFNDFVKDYYWIINVVIIVFAVLLVLITQLIGARRRNIKKHKEATIYQCALYSQAVGYYQCNLSRNLMMSPYMKIINGEPVDVLDYIPYTKNAQFSSLMDYIASHYVVTNADKFREFMNPDKLVKCYVDGDYKPEFSCWVIVPNNGEKVFQRYAYFLSQNKSGDVIATCIVYDLSKHEDELEKQRIKAESANVAKSTFLFNMTHDVRTPMNAIIGYANMAEKYIGNEEKLVDCISKIQISSQQLLVLLDDALDMSRVESGKVIINEEQINLGEHIERAKKVIMANAELQGLNVKFQVDKLKNNEIYVDSMHLNKILSNIVDNAFKYSKPNGSIIITISQIESDDENMARYSFVIKDNGIGMSPEFLEHIYEMFAREQSSTLSGIQGTGVGMAITKKLVDLMGGSISIKSEKGTGTTVKLEFDFRISKSADVIAEAEAEPEEVSFEGKRILLVEDIELNREIAREILEEEGLIVEEAVDGSIAVDMVSKSEPGYYALVFMDIQMPVMDGYEATRRIRQLENNELSSIPIIAMTANVLDEDVQNSLEAGMNAHLAKPIDIMAMFATMQKYIR